MTTITIPIQHQGIILQQLPTPRYQHEVFLASAQNGNADAVPPEFQNIGLWTIDTLDATGKKINNAMIPVDVATARKLSRFTGATAHIVIEFDESIDV